MRRVLLIAAAGALAVPVSAAVIQPTFTSCLDSYSPVAPAEAQLAVSAVYAELVGGDWSTARNLNGAGEDVLRFDLLGTSTQELSGYNSTTGKLATLFTSTSEAGVTQYTQSSYLCNSIFPANMTEPYFGNQTFCPLAGGDFGLNVSVPLYNVHALATLHTQIRGVDSSEPAQTLFCIDIHVTPYKANSWPFQLFLWFPAAIAMAFWVTTWAARFAAGWVVGVDRSTMARREVTLLKWGTMLISGMSGERFGVSTALLRFVTPGLRDIMYHIQFVTMLGMIAVSWPSFFYTIVAQSAWADLVWNVSLVSDQHPSVYSTNFTAPLPWAPQMVNPTYPLYLNSSGPGVLLDIGDTPSGMAAWARVVGLRPQDLFGTCLSLFLMLAAVIVVVSLALWLVHALTELFGHDGSRRNANRASSAGPGLPRQSTQRNSLMQDGGFNGHSRSSSNGKEWFDPRGSVELSQVALTPSSQQPRAAARPTTRSKFHRIWNRFTPKGEAGAFHFSALYGNLLRLILMFHFPITAFSVYQLSLSEASIVSRVFAALALTFISIVIPAFIMYKIYRTPTGKLYDAARTLLALGTVYNVYTADKQLYRTLPLIGSLIQGIVIGAGQQSGLAQAVVLILVELLTFVTTAFWSPWGDGASMGNQVVGISIMRIASIIMAMVLSDEISVDETPQQWLTYVILIIQAVVFVFFFFMVLTKIIEGLIRLFGGAPFDESTHPIDGGIFAAIMDLDYFSGVRGGKAAQRKQRKRDSRQLQRNVSVAGSLTTQMMLDRHSQGVSREGYQMGYYPVQNPSVDQFDRVEQYGRSVDQFGGQRSVSDHASYVSSDDTHNGILTGWRPRASSTAQQQPYSTTQPLASPSEKRNSWGGATPSIRVTDGEYYQTHARARSSGAIMEELASPRSPRSPITPPMRSLSTSPGQSPFPFPPPQYPPTGGLQDRNGVRPPPISIPRRRSLNNIGEDEAQPANLRQATKRRSRGSGNWFNRSSQLDAAENDYSSGSDDEPGPSRQSRRRHDRRPSGEPLTATVEPEPSHGWRALFTRRTRVKSERERDENAARKAVAVNESGAALVGVATPSVASPLVAPAPPGARSFRVQRKGQPPAPPRPSLSGTASSVTPLLAPPPSSFRVQRRSGGGLVDASQTSNMSHSSSLTTPTHSTPSSPAPDGALQIADQMGFGGRRSRPASSVSTVSSPGLSYLPTVTEPVTDPNRTETIMDAEEDIAAVNTGGYAASLFRPLDPRAPPGQAL